MDAKNFSPRIRRSEEGGERGSWKDPGLEPELPLLLQQLTFATSFTKQWRALVLTSGVSWAICLTRAWTILGESLKVVKL